MIKSQIISHNEEMVVTRVRESVEMYAKQAGEILLSFYKQTTLARSYKPDGSFATQADIASEKYLVEKLKPLVPGAGFYAEESGIVAGNEYEWVIDPLDGTTNFAHGVPYFCVSIALTHNKKPILGVIYQPVLKELFVAQMGKGAFLNGHTLLISQQKTMQKALISWWSDTAVDKGKFVVDMTTKLLPYESSIRSFGASALDIAYCAAGKLEGCFYRGAFWWDVAAGALLVAEAGGCVTTFSGGEVGPENTSFIAGNEPIYTELAQLIRSVYSV